MIMILNAPNDKTIKMKQDKVTHLGDKTKRDIPTNAYLSVTKKTHKSHFSINCKHEKVNMETLMVGESLPSHDK